MTARQLRKARRAAERMEHRSASSSGVSSPSPAEMKADTNRANAAHSTGPRTSEGKSRSSQNSLKYGLYSTMLVLPWEDVAEFEELRASLLAEHRPATPTEEILVSELAENFWRIRRFRYLEMQFLGAEHFDTSLIAAVQRSLAAAERGFHKALATLRQLQKERGFVSQNAENPHFEPSTELTSTPRTGFVSQTPSLADAVQAITQPVTQPSSAPQTLSEAA